MRIKCCFVLMVLTGMAYSSLAFNPGDIKQSHLPDSVLVYANHMPQFKGDISKFIRKKMKYPELAKANGIEGTVVVDFIVEKNGRINPNSIMIVKIIGWGLEEEATRLIKLMPAWKPGKQKGKPVNVWVRLSIRFRDYEKR